MSMMKHIPTLAAGLALTGSVFAMGAPQIPGRFIVGFELGYLQPNIQDLNNIPYAETNFTNVTDPSFNIRSRDKYHSVGLDHDFAYQGILGYQFANSVNQILITYQYLRESSSDSTRISNPNAAILNPQGFGVSEIFHYNFRLILFFAGESARASASLKAEYHSVNLLGSTSYDFGHYFSMTPYAGAQFAYEENTLHAFEATVFKPTQILPPPPPTGFFFDQEKVHFDNHFWGVGPKLGAILSVHIINGLDADIGVGGALLIGQADSDYCSTNTTTANFAPFSSGNVIRRFTLNHDDNFRFIPVLNGRLALRYTYHLASNALYAIVIAAGIKGEKYFDAVDNSALIDQDTAPRTGKFILTNRVRSADFMVGGPFGNLTLVF